MNISKQLAAFIIAHLLSISLSIKLGITFWMIVLVLVLWIAFMFGAEILHKYEAGKLNHTEIFLGKIYLALFMALDVFVNYTAMTYFFLEVPDNDRKTVTDRLKHYIHRGTKGWRYRLAVFIGKYMVTPHDKGHLDK